MICEDPIQRGPLKGQPATGTEAGYLRHWRRGKVACDDCLAGEAAAGRKRYPKYRDQREAALLGRGDVAMNHLYVAKPCGDEPCDCEPVLASDFRNASLDDLIAVAVSEGGKVKEVTFTTPTGHAYLGPVAPGWYLVLRLPDEDTP